MSHTPTPWKTYYATRPLSTIDGWSIKRDSDIQEPIGILPEPMGGIKNKHGRSPSQQANAELIVQAVNSYQAMKEALEDALYMIRESIKDYEELMVDNEKSMTYGPWVADMYNTQHKIEKALTLANGGANE